MGQPQTLRKLNRRHVLQALLDAPALTRPQLAEQLGLSKVTVAAIVQELLEHQVVGLSALPGQAIGRTPQAVQLSPTIGTALAIDLQAHSIQGQAFSLHGDRTSSFGQLIAPQDVVSAAERIIREVYTTAPFGPLSSVVVSVPAPVDPLGRIGEPNALSSFDPTPLHAAARELELDVVYENDANLVALALSCCYPDSTTLAAVIERPTGIGMGLILNGQLYRGPQGRAGELGNAPWPGQQGVTCIEQLPVAERLDATAYSLAGLAIGLDLEHLLLVFEEAEQLASRLRRLLDPGVKLTLPPSSSGLPLQGAGLLARRRASARLLDSLADLRNLEPHVA
ncbi:ROK family transcriptional regulator [Deinococcus budaensis]|uniref:ROK family transcriptional regulator n=1 Tax=Deinococcus budaensis TaxID=1665626 RepID=UPI00160D4519|nr:ROK family protein [Deinococcus budaensis]